MSIPLYIITGFLGSGKTTLLKRIVEHYADTLKIGVVQNEFAALNVDAAELRHTGKAFSLLEVNRGSVFCVCRVADFKTGLSQFVDEFNLNAVFLEASGLSDPIAVVEILQAPELIGRVFLGKMWCIVDASSFLQMERVNVRLTHQVRVADVVVVNKIDKTDQAKIDEVLHRVREMNPFAEVLQTSYCNENIELDSIDLPVAVQQKTELAHFEPQGRPEIGTAVIKSTRKLSRESLNVFLNEFLADVYRLKGHAQLNDGTAVKIQSTLGDLYITEIQSYVGPTEIIAIGPDINAKPFSKRFREMAE